MKEKFLIHMDDAQQDHAEQLLAQVNQLLADKEIIYILFLNNISITQVCCILKCTCVFCYNKTSAHNEQLSIFLYHLKPFPKLNLSTFKAPLYS